MLAHTAVFHVNIHSQTDTRKERNLSHKKIQGFFFYLSQEKYSLIDAVIWLLPVMTLESH